VDDLVAVGILDCLADLSDDRQLCGQGGAGGLAGQPQVESLPRVVVVVDQADTEVGLDKVSWPQESVVLKARHDSELMLRELANPCALAVGCAGGGDLEADPCLLLLGHLVGRQPVLPAVALGDGLLLDHPRAGLPLTALDEADPRHQVNEDQLLVGADRLPVWLLEDQLRDAREPAAVLAAVEAIETDRARRAQL